MPKEYSVGIVGEARCQDAIDAGLEGTPVALVPEPDNPYDPRAIRVDNHRGQTIGYLPRDEWLTDVILDQRLPIEAVIEQVTGQDKPKQGIVLAVELGVGSSVKEPGYRAPPSKLDKLGEDMTKAGQSITQIGCGCLVLIVIAFVATALIGMI